MQIAQFPARRSRSGGRHFGQPPGSFMHSKRSQTRRGWQSVGSGPQVRGLPVDMYHIRHLTFARAEKLALPVLQGSKTFIFGFESHPPLGVVSHGPEIHTKATVQGKEEH